jgi:fimbrial isopeptide formation D2 family protein
VRLLDSNGNVVATTTTDSNGNYLFANLQPGTYSVEFVKPAGYALTTANAGGNDAADSDADKTTGRTQSVTLAGGENNLTLDAGLVKLGKIGDKVWYDTDVDGVQDNTEPAIPNVTVRLLDSNGNVIATTTTDSNGNYLFDNLEPGNYTVEFITANGYVITFNDRGGNDATDSDANMTTGRANVSLGYGETNLTIDAGMVAKSVLDAILTPSPTPTTPAPTATPVPGQPSISKSVDKTNVKPGETITYTITVRNNNSTAIQNAVVTDTLDSRLTYVSGNTSKGSVSSSGQTVTATIGTLNAGETVTITITARVASTVSAPAQINNTASLGGTGISVTTSNVAGIQIVPNNLPITGERSEQPTALVWVGLLSALFVALSSIQLKAKGAGK